MTQTDQQHVPKLRFPGFEGAWKSHRLSDAWQVKGKRNRKEQYTREQVLSVSGDAGVVNQIELLGRSYAGVSVADYHIVETGDIVYTKSPLKTNPYGIIKANHGDPGIVSTLYAVYEVRKGHSPAFWNAYFSLNDRTNKYLLPLVHKGAKNDMKINNERVLIDPVSSPTAPEQRKIAEFLGAVDTKIAQLAENKRLLEDYKKGCMQQIFSQKNRFKDDTGNDFPDWEEKRLGSLGRFIGGGTPDTKVEAYWNGETPWVSSSDLSDGLVQNLKINRWITEAAIKSSATQTIPKGAILIVTRVGIGKCAIAPEDLCTSQDFTNFVPESEVTEFLAYWISFNQRIIQSLGQGTSIKGVTTHDLKALIIHTPHPEEQRKIADFLSVLDRKIDLAGKELDHARTFKQGLLQQMFV